MLVADVVDVVGVVEFDIDGPDSLGSGAACASAAAPTITMAARPLVAKSLRIMSTFRFQCARSAHPYLLYEWRRPSGSKVHLVLHQVQHEMADPLTGQLPGKSVGPGLAAKPRPGACGVPSSTSANRRGRECAPTTQRCPIVDRSTAPDEGAADGQFRQDPTYRPPYASRASCHVGSGRHFRCCDCSGRGGMGDGGPFVELCSIRPDLRNRHYGKFDGRRSRARMWCSSARLVSRRRRPARRPRASGSGSVPSRGDSAPDDNAGHLVRPVTSLTISKSFDIAFPLHPTDAVERRAHHTDRSS